MRYHGTCAQDPVAFVVGNYVFFSKALFSIEIAFRLALPCCALLRLVRSLFLALGTGLKPNSNLNLPLFGVQK